MSYRKYHVADESESSSVGNWILILLIPAIAIVGILILASQDEGLSVPPSLDFTGGTRLEYQIDEKDAIRKGIDSPEGKRGALERIQELFLFRLRNFDLSEIIVKPVGDDRLMIEIPGTEAIERVKQNIGNPAVLTFRAVIGEPLTVDQFLQLSESDQRFYYLLEGTEYYLPVSEEPIFDVSGIDYKQTRVQAAQDTLKPYIVIALNPGAGEEFAAMTSQYYDQVIAICLDELIVSAPRVAASDISEPIIEGEFTTEEANDLARILRSGPMPVSLDLATETSTSPALGQDNLRRGLIGMAVGFAFFVVIFVLAYADHLAMLVTAAICIILEAAFIYIFARMGWFITLNMIALAGLTVLLGMAVDNLILVFEEFRSRQLKEEDLTHRQLISGVRKAFKDEAGIILRANVVAVIALWPLSFLDGPIQDLVAVMIVGTIITLIITVWFARGLLTTKEFLIPLDDASPSRKRLIPIRFDLLRLNRPFLLLYVIAVIVSIVSLSTKGLELGLDFKGGTEISIISSEGIGLENLRTYAAQYFGDRVEVKRLTNNLLEGSSFEYIVWAPASDAAATEETNSNIVADRFVAAMQKELSPTIKLGSVKLLGSTVLGLSLSRALTYATVGIVLLVLFIGISLRNGFRYFLPVLFATILDGLIIMGAISLFQVPLSIPVIGTVLTILSYSTNDSIVLCGHIVREFSNKEEEISQRLKEMRLRDKQELVQVTQDAGKFTGRYVGNIMKDLSLRVILTSLTTVVAAIALWITGQGILRDFGLIVTIGIIVGTFSSVSLVASRMQSIHTRDIYKLANEILHGEHNRYELETESSIRRDI